MSAADVIARFLPQAQAACAGGRGEQLLHDMLAAVAVDFASTIFLRMEDKVSRALPEEGEALWAWAEQYPHACGVDLIEAITATFEQLGISDGEQVETAQMVTATAYQQELDRLLGSAQLGGRA